jgi:hypothetical protein
MGKPSRQPRHLRRSTLENTFAKKDKNYSGGVFADLRTAMMQNDCEVWERQWVGGCYLFKYPSSDAFLIAYNDDQAAIEEAISGAFWTMATD